MIHHDLTKPRNIGIGATAAPLLVIGVLTLFNGASDPRSSAADVQAPADPEAIIRPQMGNITEAQMAAMRYREQIHALGEADSPFPRFQDRSAGLSDRPGRHLPDRMYTPDFMVSAMIVSEAGNIALINGKAHHEGDELDGGWIIKEIDARTKRVVLVDARGKSMTLGLNRP